MFPSLADCMMRPHTSLKKVRYVLAVAVVIVLSGCANAPVFDLANVDRLVQPRQVAAEPHTYQSKQVLWGGVIISSRNVQQGSELEVLAHPLDRNLKPDDAAEALGRFIAFERGYLETLDYAPGRLVTLVGVVERTEQRSVGEALYTYPVITISQLHIWPEQDASGESRVRFGIGVGVSVH